MRLTLRTLLAWLDDKLPPSEVRAIGKQVDEIPYAKELVKRIHRVTSQRRLTVPPATGPDSVDANLVAAYIDNELEAERVAEFEKKCLGSDVHLAEVSSTHQILSLVGQKAKVPGEARLRMYGLIKGRESIRPTREEVERAAVPDPEPEGPQVWMIPEAPRRRWLERFGPVAAVLGLIGVLAFSAWWTLKEESDHPTLIALGDNPDGPTAADRVLAGEQPFQPPLRKPTGAEPSETTEPPAPEAPAAPPAPTQPAEAPAEAAPQFPPGSVGLAEKPKGVLLRFNDQARDWERLTEATPLKEQDRLLSLVPFRSTLEIGSAKLDLVGETEVWVKATPRTEASRFSLARGRVVLHGTTPARAFEVQVGAITATILPPPGSSVGLERVIAHEFGAEAPKLPGFLVIATEVPVRVSIAGGTEYTIEEVGAILLGAGIEAPTSKNGPPPSWIAETEPSPYDLSIGDQFLESFRDGQKVLNSIVEASESENKEVCRLGVAALGAVDREDLSYLIAILDRSETPSASSARKAAIVALRGYLAEGPKETAKLETQLLRDQREEIGPLTLKLLKGHGAAEAAQEETFGRLVDLLGARRGEPVGIRELALDNLKTLTGRDDLGYDPEKPDEKGVKPWRDLLKEHELKAVPRKDATP